MDIDESALCALGKLLKSRGYRFTTVTPETHRRVLARSSGRGRDQTALRSLRDIFGWSMTFVSSDLDRELLAALVDAGALEQTPDGLRSRVRFSSLGEQLFAHSAYPTLAAESVFFGPDTHRFASLLARHARPCRRVVDIGCGSGAGGASIAHLAQNVVLADVSATALVFARANAALNSLARAEVVISDVLDQISGEVDLVVANPPYLVDPAARLYRDGGGPHGIDLAVRIVRESMARLAPGGRLVLYTGTPVVLGEDVFRTAVTACLPAQAQILYEELDPDVFGEELDRPAYARADRLAVVGLVATLP